MARVETRVLAYLRTEAGDARSISYRKNYSQHIGLIDTFQRKNEFIHPVISSQAQRPFIKRRHPHSHVDQLVTYLGDDCIQTNALRSFKVRSDCGGSAYPLPIGENNYTVRES